MPDPAMATTRWARRREQPMRSCCGTAGMATAAARRRSATRERWEDARDDGAAAILSLAAAVGGGNWRGGGEARLGTGRWQPSSFARREYGMLRAAATTGHGERARGGVGEGQRPVRESGATAFCMADHSPYRPTDRAPRAPDPATFRRCRDWAEIPGPAGPAQLESDWRARKVLVQPLESCNSSFPPWMDPVRVRQCARIPLPLPGGVGEAFP